MMMIYLSQLGRGPNHICRGMLCKMAKTPRISLIKSTNDLGLDALAEREPLSRILRTPMITFAPCRELESFRFGVLDVGYVYFLISWRKIFSSLLDRPGGRRCLFPSPESDYRQASNAIGLYPWFNPRLDLCRRYFGVDMSSIGFMNELVYVPVYRLVCKLHILYLSIIWLFLPSLVARCAMLLIPFQETISSQLNLFTHGFMNELVYVPVCRLVCKLHILYLSISYLIIPSKPCWSLCYVSNPISRNVFR